MNIVGLVPGERVGPYVIDSEIGRGGMGEVYRARDTRLGRDVALKLLPADVAGDADRRQRFEREARAVARLNHPGILTLYDVGEYGTALFLVTELLAGETLRARLDRGVPAWREAVDWAAQLADALARAHEHDVIHRDVKPENLWLTPDGRLKILDFGIARVATPRVDEETATGQAPVTSAGQVVGTSGYMSPEQVRGQPVDARTDLFSAGVVLYEMLTGMAPFARASVIDALSAILRDDPPPPALPPGCPTAAGALVLRCLARHPDARFADARALASALRALTAVPDVSSPDGAARVAAASDDPGAMLEQHIAYCTTRDGVRIAYATAGSGPLLVRVLGWFTHLEMEWAWPDLRFFWQQLARQHTVIRYDGRGIGLSDPWAGEFTEQTRQLDLEAVLDAVGPRSAALLGISEGGWTAAAFAVAYPERIDHLVIYGGYARGATARPGYDPDEDQALLTLMRKGWGRETPAFRQVFTSQFFHEDADPAVLAHFNELQRASADPDTAARYAASCQARADGAALFRQLRTPTLVAHRRGDRSVGFAEGRHLASVVPGARFLPLPGSAHYFPTGRPGSIEPGTIELVEGITRFLRS